MPKVHRICFGRMNEEPVESPPRRVRKHGDGSHNEGDHGNWAHGEAPKRGMRFLHSRWLDPDTKAPLEHVVTRVERGVVHYRPVYPDGTRGKPEYTSLEKFGKVVLRVLPGELNKHADHDQKSHGNREVRVGVHDYSQGERFGTVTAEGTDAYAQYGLGRNQGRIDYSEYLGEVWVKYVEVAPEHRRQGVATEMLSALGKTYPDSFIRVSMTTPDGSEWAASKAVRRIIGEHNSSVQARRRSS